MSSDNVPKTATNFNHRRQIKVAAVVNDTSTQILLNTFLKKFGFHEFNVFIGLVDDMILKLQKGISINYLIVDISRETSPIPELEKMSRFCPPNVNVLLLGSQDNIALYRELIGMGAIEYLVKPLSENLFAKAMERMGEVKSSPQSRLPGGQVIGVLGARGGVGSTTAVLNLGRVFANVFDRNVSLVDLNLVDGTLALDLGLKPSSGFQELLEDASRIDDVFVKRAARHYGSRLSIFATDGGYNQATNIDVDAVSRLLVVLRANYDFVLLDIPRIPVEAMMAVLDTVDVRIFVMNRTVASVRNCDRLLNLSGEKDGRKNLVVINDLGISKKHDVPIAKIHSFLGRPIDAIVPTKKVSVLTTGISGGLATNKNDPVSRAYQKVADLIAGPLPQIKRSNRWLSAFIKG